MSTINVLNMAGETVGTVELCDGIFWHRAQSGCCA